MIKFCSMIGQSNELKTILATEISIFKPEILGKKQYVLEVGDLAGRVFGDSVKS